MPAKGRECSKRTYNRRQSADSVIGAGIAGAWQALLFAQAGRDVTLYERGDAGDDAGHQPLGRRHAGALLRGRSRRTDDHAGSACARWTCGARNAARNAVQRLAGGGACARPRRFRTLCQADDRPPARRCRRHRRARARAGGPLPRGAVLRRRRPCRAAPRAAGAARAAARRRRHHPVRQRTARRTISTAS